MNVLDLIVPELKYLANTLSAVLNLDITIVDASLKRLVGTGHMEKKVGDLSPEGSAFSQCIQSGRHLFVEEPRVSSICRSCSARQNLHRGGRVLHPHPLQRPDRRRAGHVRLLPNHEGRDHPKQGPYAGL